MAKLRLQDDLFLLPENDPGVTDVSDPYSGLGLTSEQLAEAADTLGWNGAECNHLHENDSLQDRTTAYDVVAPSHEEHGKAKEIIGAAASLLYIHGVGGLLAGRQFIVVRDIANRQGAYDPGSASVHLDRDEMTVHTVVHELGHAFWFEWLTEPTRHAFCAFLCGDKDKEVEAFAQLWTYYLTGYQGPDEQAVTPEAVEMFETLITEFRRETGTPFVLRGELPSVAQAGSSIPEGCGSITPPLPTNEVLNEGLSLYLDLMGLLKFQPVIVPQPGPEVRFAIQKIAQTPNGWGVTLYLRDAVLRSTVLHALISKQAWPLGYRVTAFEPITLEVYQPNAPVKEVLGTVWRLVTNALAAGAAIHLGSVGAHPATRVAVESATNPQPLKVFCDLDGVLVDLDSQRPVGLSDDDWNLRVWSMTHEQWAALPWKPDGKALWEALKPYNPTVLSSPTRAAVSRTGKTEWVHKHLGPTTPLILESDKSKYAKAASDVLIDDWKKQTEAWAKAGGTAILHKTTAQTLIEFQKLRTQPVSESERQALAEEFSTPENDRLVDKSIRTALDTVAANGVGNLSYSYLRSLVAAAILQLPEWYAAAQNDGNQSAVWERFDGLVSHVTMLVYMRLQAARAATGQPPVEESKFVGHRTNIAGLPANRFLQDPSTGTVIPEMPATKAIVAREKSAAESAFRRLKDDADQTIWKLVQEWLDGKIKFPDLATRTATAWRSIYEQVWFAGRRSSGLHQVGTTEVADREEQDWFRNAVREELGYWNNFLSEMREEIEPDGTWDRKYSIRERFEMYLETLKFMYDAGRTLALPPDVLIYWAGPGVNDRNICEGCKYLVEHSPYTRETLPAVPRASTPCLTNCRHKLLVRRATTEQVIERDRALPFRLQMVEALERIFGEKRPLSRLGGKYGAKAHNPWKATKGWTLGLEEATATQSSIRKRFTRLHLVRLNIAFENDRQADSMFAWLKSEATRSVSLRVVHNPERRPQRQVAVDVVLSRLGVNPVGAVSPYFDNAVSMAVWGRMKPLIGEDVVRYDAGVPVDTSTGSPIADLVVQFQNSEYADEFTDLMHAALDPVRALALVTKPTADTREYTVRLAPLGVRDNRPLRWDAEQTLYAAFEKWVGQQGGPMESVVGWKTSLPEKFVRHELDMLVQHTPVLHFETEEDADVFRSWIRRLQSPYIKDVFAVHKKVSLHLMPLVAQNAASVNAFVRKLVRDKEAQIGEAQIEVLLPDEVLDEDMERRVTLDYLKSVRAMIAEKVRRELVPGNPKLSKWAFDAAKWKIEALNPVGPQDFLLRVWYDGTPKEKEDLNFFVNYSFDPEYRGFQWWWKQGGDPANPRSGRMRGLTGEPTTLPANAHLSLIYALALWTHNKQSWESIRGLPQDLLIDWALWAPEGDLSETRLDEFLGALIAAPMRVVGSVLSFVGRGLVSVLSALVRTIPGLVRFGKAAFSALAEVFITQFKNYVWDPGTKLIVAVSSAAATALWDAIVKALTSQVGINVAVLVVTYLVSWPLFGGALLAVALQWLAARGAKPTTVLRTAEAVEERMAAYEWPDEAFEGLLSAHGLSLTEAVEWRQFAKNTLLSMGISGAATMMYMAIAGTVLLIGLPVNFLVGGAFATVRAILFTTKKLRERKGRLPTPSEVVDAMRTMSPDERQAVVAA